ncbi:MAG: biotin/lipoyl-binding protein [Chloroflexota bacterium]|jgi:biotin carboxyl carrier protein
MSKRVTVIVEGREYVVEVGDLSESPIRATVNNRTYQVNVPRAGAPSSVAEVPENAPSVTVPQPAVQESAPRSPAPTASTIFAPIPGNIIEVNVQAGDSVQPGDVICVLEAMKMNNKIYADKAGVVARVAVVAGQAVEYGDPLVIFQ